MGRKKQKAKHHNFFSLIFRVILVVFAAMMLISYVSVFINPAVFWFPSFFGLYFIPIFIANSILLIIALIRRSRSAWVPFIILLPSLLLCEYYLKTPREEKEINGTPYKILTYNVGQFSSSKEHLSKKECMDSVVRFVEKERPDVACFQEFYTSDTTSINNLFPGYRYKHYHFFKVKDNYYFGNLTISRYPVISSGKISFKGSTNLSIFSDIRFSDTTTARVYNNHLESYNISLTSLIKSSHSISDEIINVHGKMRGSNLKRARQVDVVMNHIKECDHLCIVCGDFNDTPMSYTYHQLKKVSKDTFVEAGQGFSATYSVLWPLLRIDYILIPDSFDASSHTTPKIKMSDHYPVLSIIYKNNGI